MGPTASLAGNRHRRRLPRRVLALVVQNHPYRTGTDLITKFGRRRRAHHDPSLLESRGHRLTPGRFIGKLLRPAIESLFRTAREHGVFLS